MKSNAGKKHHGKSYSRVYGVWEAMIARCSKPKTKYFENYGGRGISVCQRWLDFRNFYSDMGDPPPGLTLDRIDNDGNYEPNNCRWVDRIAQSRNSRVRRDSKTGIRCVFLHRASGRYCAYIDTFGVRNSLGYYNTAEEAGKISSRVHFRFSFGNERTILGSHATLRG